VSRPKENLIPTYPVPTPPAQTPARVGIPSFSERRDHLRATLLPTVDLLHRRRADLIGDGMIADYVALHWLEWNGGALRLTATGQGICDQIESVARHWSLEVDRTG
jgi:hypothetical protein